MFRVYFFVLFFVFFYGLSQNQYNDNGDRQGLWIGYYDSGELKYKGYFDNGKEKGVFKYYYKSGNLEKELQYITPGAYAKVRIYYSNRMIKAFGEYCFKKRCGCWEYFNDSGKIIYKENYENGMLEGDFFVYFEGLLIDLYTYKNDKKNGMAKSFFLSGKVKIISHYINNKLHGEYSVFSKEGKLVEKGNYVDGFRDGKWYIYNEMEKFVNYKNGKIIN